jgi:VWFA-related protein
MMRACLLVLAGATAVAGAQAPHFRTRTDLVRIDVLAERNGRPVAGLTAADFVVEDAGVVQRRVELFPVADALTVSTVLDVSGSVTDRQLDLAGAAMQALLAGLRAGDGHTLYAFSGEAREIALPADRRSVSIDAVARALRDGSGPRTSLLDALYVAIVRGDRSDGPKLAIVVTDGHDNTSWLSAQAVIDAALRHDTVISVVAMRQPAPSYAVDVPPVAGDAGLRLVQVLAERTGGRVVHADWSRDLGPILASVLSEYRQRYILSYVPDGVARGDGWHPLRVRLKTHRGRVHARSGYWSR